MGSVLSGEKIKSSDSKSVLMDYREQKRALGGLE